MTQDQFTQVSKKVSDIPEENFTINIELFRQNFSNVELLRQKWIVLKVTSPGREPMSSDLHSSTLPLRHTFFLIQSTFSELPEHTGLCVLVAHWIPLLCFRGTPYTILLCLWTTGLCVLVAHWTPLLCFRGTPYWRIQSVQRSYIFDPRCLTEVKQHD
jgi:hypothetical protein